MNSTNNKWFNWGLFITLFVNTAVGIGGLYLVNYLNLSRDIKNKRLEIKRDIENKKREIKIEYLINVYRNIEKSSGYPAMNFSQSTEKDIKRAEDLEQALADIQLFGSIYQIREARNSCEKAIPTPDKSDPNLMKSVWRADDLLLDIRRELRKELLLEEIDPKEDKQEGITKLRRSKIMEIFYLNRKINQTP